MAIDENLKWDDETLPSEILKQIFELEAKSKDRTQNNVHATAYAYGKALAMEQILGIENRL